MYRLLNQKNKWEWNEQDLKAFKWAKQVIASDQVLMHYYSNLPLVLSCDASNYGIGACLAPEIIDPLNPSKMLERP